MKGTRGGEGDKEDKVLTTLQVHTTLQVQYEVASTYDVRRDKGKKG